MRVIEFSEENFEEVLRICKVCDASISTSTPQQIHYNPVTHQFEHYPPEEFNDIPDDILFDHPHNVISAHMQKKEEMSNAVATADSYEASDEDNSDEEYTTESGEELSPIFANDDPEVLKATSHNLNVINSISKQLQEERREALARVVADIYKCDTISDSDVARSLVENDEYKKLLSMLFGMLGVSVSTTKVSTDLKVSTGNLTFNERITYGLEDYRRGAAQCLTDVRRLAEAGEQIKVMEETNRELNASIASIRKELTAANDKYMELQTQRAVKKDQNLLNQPTFVISWKSGQDLRFLRLKDNAKVGKDGSFPTKYLEKTSKISKASEFTEDQARLQLDRMIKHKDNLTFVDLKDAGAKQASEFFSIYKTTIEKV